MEERIARLQAMGGQSYQSYAPSRPQAASAPGGGPWGDSAPPRGPWGHSPTAQSPRRGPWG
jgi:hypothetical protein